MKWKFNHNHDVNWDNICKVICQKQISISVNWQLTLKLKYFEMFDQEKNVNKVKKGLGYSLASAQVST